MRPLRLAVLRPGGTEADAEWPGDDALETGHFAVRSDDHVVIAVATIVEAPHPEDGRDGDWRLRGMATDVEHRGRGLAALLVDACVEHAALHGASRVWLQARPAAVSLYSRAGFAVETDEFDVPGLGPHVRMARAV